MKQTNISKILADADSIMKIGLRLVQEKLPPTHFSNTIPKARGGAREGCEGLRKFSGQVPVFPRPLNT